MNNKAKLCSVIISLGEIRGRKRLHKIIHIANALGYQVGYSFEWANYGPFSNDLHIDLTALRDENVISETQVNNHGYKEYIYQATELCHEYVNLFEDTEIPNIDAILQRLNKEETKSLELLSSILYLKGQGETGEALVAFLHELKPHFEPQRIRLAIPIADNLIEEYGRL